MYIDKYIGILNIQLDLATAYQTCPTAAQKDITLLLRKIGTSWSNLVTLVQLHLSLHKQHTTLQSWFIFVK